MKNKYFKTIRSKIMLSNVVFALLFSIIISGIVYVNYRERLMKNMVEVMTANLKLVMDNMDEDFSQIKSIMEWGTINSKLPALLLDEEINNSNSADIVDFIKMFSDMVNSSTASENIEKVIIGGNTDVSMQLGKMYGSIKDVELLNSKAWFNELYLSDKLNWVGLVKNDFEYSTSEYIIPIVRPVYSYKKHDNVGYIMIGIDSKMPYKYLKEYSAYEDSEIMLCNSKGQIIADNDNNKIGHKVENYENISSLMDNSNVGSIEWEENGKKINAVYQRSKVTGWCMIQKLSEAELKEQRQIVIRLLVAVIGGIAIMSFLLSAVLSYYINRPIKNIVSRIDKIAKGDFNIDPMLETDDELGKIGYGINNMSGNIVSLMNKSINDEKNKRELELKVLQTQVNPHFLYNTLNSIKWMATIQKASGIGEMATALSRLLRNMAKGVSNQITIEDELSLVNDYITIQQFRYGESFKVEYDVEDELKQFKVVKFTLQPIVENAIFHGLEPKAGLGLINITIKEAGENIKLSIKDNGIGMDSESIKSILNEKDSKNKESLNGIGVSNVNERIKLVYGEDYGLSIMSELYEFTEINIVIPKVK